MYIGMMVQYTLYKYICSGVSVVEIIDKTCKLGMVIMIFTF